MTVLFTETVGYALKRGLIRQSELDALEPSLFFLIPRLTVI